MKPGTAAYGSVAQRRGQESVKLPQGNTGGSSPPWPTYTSVAERYMRQAKNLRRNRIHCGFESRRGYHREIDRNLEAGRTVNPLSVTLKVQVLLSRLYAAPPGRVRRLIPPDGVSYMEVYSKR